eukprot:5495782-Prymnesium_polylepis.2
MAMVPQRKPGTAETPKDATVVKLLESLPWDPRRTHLLRITTGSTQLIVQCPSAQQRILWHDA